MDNDIDFTKMSNEYILDKLYEKHRYDFDYNREYMTLSELEEKILCLFFCSESHWFRSDFHVNDEFSSFISGVLNDIIRKMPYCKEQKVCRYCNKEDISNFCIGDTIVFKHSLTTSTALTNMMSDYKWTHKYIITLKNPTKAHEMFHLWKPKYNAMKEEYQVNFEENSRFVISDIKNSSQKLIYMTEI